MRSSTGRRPGDGGLSGEFDEVRVLHVEDDSAFADLTAEFLERDDSGVGLSVDTETDPERAVDHLDDVDCVVSDYDMPAMDGLDVLATVRERDAEIPFILFTGRGSEEIATQAINEGVTDYLRKESGTDQFTVLANSIRNAVERQRVRRAAERGRQRLRSVLDLLPQCVLVKNVDGRYLLANEAGAAQYDRQPQELEGCFEGEIMREDLADRFLAQDREVVESGEPMRIPEQCVTGPNGVERVERVTKTPFDVPEAEGPAVLVLAEDVTEEVQLRGRLDDVNDAVGDARRAFDELDVDGSTARRLEAALADAAAAATGDSDSPNDA